MSKVIKVSNLSKRYRLGLKEKQVETLAGQVANVIKSPLQNLKRLKDLSRFGEDDESVFWALKDVSFEVKGGEVLGIIGKNGAGKSTLLKILSQITEPTSGKIEIHGRVASLLEVGTGFHPELSGRENIYMNGTILGMTRREIDSKLDEIIDFSGVEKFIDTPVKFYSSGMKVRLGFSVAAHLDPEILIIDEVLAVGDYEFQKKCLGKMEDVSKNQGRTVLFVSHQMDAITRLCSRVLVLKNGEVNYQGVSSIAVKKYLGTEENEQGAKAVLSQDRTTNQVAIQKVEIKSNSNLFKDWADVREEMQVEISFEVLQDGLIVSPGINVHNEKGDHLFTSHHVDYMVNPFPLDKGVYEVSVTIPAHFFAEGVIYFSVALMSYEPFTVYQHEEKIISLTITDSVDGSSARGIYAGYFPGLIRPKLFWKEIKKTNL
ncbi:ABC transporter ATP-binding protein [Algoriphagus marincola]|uniref:ABC transporter ATP-binding protein n=1 Tax=Algoriphagus marincola TaxID=264027 RepID=A0ABS7N6R5_9BACT|nr:ABC transporter ATP-binding protein [Algoriphagus marincola]MBY5950855.1 ABC transporter ATP-binding protein [Algoriphagus marincola]